MFSRKSLQTDKTGIFREPFLIDSVSGVGKKDIIAYIRGKAYQVFKDDFYYGYTYNGDVLSFVALHSDVYDVGKLSIFTPAFVNEGRYFLRPPGQEIYYFIENQGGMLKTEIAYEPRDGAEDLQTIDFNYGSLVKSQKTLMLQWSLAQPTRNVNLVLGSFLAISLGCLFFASSQYKNVSLHATSIVSAPQKFERATVRLPDMASTIKHVGDDVSGVGVIRKVEIQMDKVNFAIEFKAEQYAQTFINQHGGKYENGKVLYSTGFSNPGNPGHIGQSTGDKERS